MSATHSLTFCPRCGGAHFKSGNFKPWSCPDCQFEYFPNTAAAAGALICDEQNRLLLVRRSQNPKKGLWHVPGGFIDAGETAEIALARECMEEVDLEISDIHYIGAFPNTYQYGGIIYNTLDIFYSAKSSNLKDARAVSEVDLLKWVPLQEVNLHSVAFPSCQSAISLLQQKNA